MCLLIMLIYSVCIEMMEEKKEKKKKSPFRVIVACYCMIKVNNVQSIANIICVSLDLVEMYNA